MFQTYLKTKENQQELKRTSQVIISYGFSFLFVKYDYFDTFGFLKDLFSSFDFFLYSQKGVHNHKRCYSTKLPGSTDQFPFGSIWPLSLLGDKKRDDLTAMRSRKLHLNWWLVRLLCITSGLDYLNVFGLGDTLPLPSKWNNKLIEIN